MSVTYHFLAGSACCSGKTHPHGDDRYVVKSRLINQLVALVGLYMALQEAAGRMQG